MTFKKWRISNGWTQKKVAIALDVTVQEVWRWESGRNRPNTSNLYQIDVLSRGQITQWGKIDVK